MADLGYSSLEIDGAINYTKGNGYIKFSNIIDFDCIVIEFAENEQDAKKGLYEDTDRYALKTDEEELLKTLKEDLEKYY